MEGLYICHGMQCSAVFLKFWNALYAFLSIFTFVYLSINRILKTPFLQGAQSGVQCCTVPTLFVMEIIVEVCEGQVHGLSALHSSPFPQQLSPDDHNRVLLFSCFLQIFQRGRMRIFSYRIQRAHYEESCVGTSFHTSIARGAR